MENYNITAAGLVDVVVIIVILLTCRYEQGRKATKAVSRCVFLQANLDTFLTMAKRSMHQKILHIIKLIKFYS